MAEVENHTNGKHALEDDDVPVKAKLLKGENGSSNGKETVKNGDNHNEDQDDVGEVAGGDESNTNDASNGALVESNNGESSNDVAAIGRKRQAKNNLGENSTSNYGDEGEDGGEGDVDDGEDEDDDEVDGDDGEGDDDDDDVDDDEDDGEGDGEDDDEDDDDDEGDDDEDGGEDDDDEGDE